MLLFIFIQLFINSTFSLTVCMRAMIQSLQLASFTFSSPVAKRQDPDRSEELEAALCQAVFKHVQNAYIFFVLHYNALCLIRCGLNINQKPNFPFT